MKGSDLEAAGRDKSPVQIRDCRGDDFESVLELLTQLWPGTEIDPDAMRQVFQRLLDWVDCQVFCAVVAGRMVGFCDFFVRYSLWQQGKLAYVDELVVDESMRGRGIGASLLDRAAHIAEGLGCSRIELDTDLERTVAQRFYEDQGWRRRSIVFGKDLR